MLPKRKTARLGFGRFSIPGAIYFVTFVTKGRRTVLAEPENGGLIADSLIAMHRAGDAVVWAATIMPDHVHMLFTLGPRLNLGQISGHLKSTARRGRQIDWEWQMDGFERQVRSTESLEDYAFYIFMNPYCAGLCALSEVWPWWTCPEPNKFRFLHSLQGKRDVPQAWIGLNDQLSRTLVTGD